MVPEFWINKAPFMASSPKSQNMFVSMGTYTTLPKHNLTFGWNLFCHIQSPVFDIEHSHGNLIVLLFWTINNHITNTSENNNMIVHIGIFSVVYKIPHEKHIFCWPLYTSWMTCSLNFAVYDQKTRNKVFWGKSWHKDKPIFCWHLIPLLPALDLLCQYWRFDKKWGAQEQNTLWWLRNQCRCLFTNPFRVNMITPAALSCFPVWSWQLLFSDISQENSSGRCHKRPCIHCQEQESNIPIVLQLLPVIHWDFVWVKPHCFTEIAINGNQDIEYLLNWMLHLLTNDLRKLAYTQWWMQTTEKRTTSKTILTDLNEYMLPSLFFFLNLL